MASERNLHGLVDEVLRTPEFRIVVVVVIIIIIIFIAQTKGRKTVQ